MQVLAGVRDYQCECRRRHGENRSFHRTTLYSGIVKVFVTVKVWICTGLLCGEVLVALGSFPVTKVSRN